MSFHRKPTATISCPPTRDALAKAQAKASELEVEAEAARWESLSPAQRADELSRKASRARMDADILEGEVAAAEDETDPSGEIIAEDADGAEDGDAPDNAGSAPTEPAPTAQASNVLAALPAMPQLPHLPPDSSRAEFDAAVQRAAEMEAIAVFAKRHGVGFDLQRAIQSHLTVRAAREQVQNVRAEADEALQTDSIFAHVSQAAANASHGWELSIERAAARRGLKMPGNGR